MKLRHRRRVTASHLLDQAVRGFALRDVVQTGANSPAGIQPVTTAAINLKDRMSEGRVASFSQDASGVRVGIPQRLPAADRAQTDRQTEQENRHELLP